MLMYLMNSCNWKSKLTSILYAIYTKTTWDMPQLSAIVGWVSEIYHSL